jgi:hypothetical protein
VIHWDANLCTHPPLNKAGRARNRGRRSGVHQLGGQPLDRSETALDHLAEADLLGMVNSLLEFSR